MALKKTGVSYICVSGIKKIGDESLERFNVLEASRLVLMSNNSSIIHHPGLFQDQPFLSTDFNEKSGSLRITPSYSGLPALFCEFD